jgi:DNA-binding NtrC family response regulator
MQPINVLMIDDDILVQKFANMALTDRGMNVYGACDTAEADAILDHKKIDIIVCDVLMSPESGLEYCNRLRNRLVRTPMILISGQVSPVAMQKSVRAGAAAYLIKPFGIDQIYQRILEVLASRSRMPINTKLS